MAFGERIALDFDALPSILLFFRIALDLDAQQRILQDNSPTPQF
jgi:hypothetical protein